MKQLKKNILLYSISTMLLLIIPLVNNISFTLGSLILFFDALIVYFYISLNKKNFYSLNSIFSAIWLGTISLSNLKILSYQRIWSNETWLYLALGFLIFNIFIEIGNTKKNKRIDSILENLNFENFNNKYLFFVCLLFGFIAVFGFIMTAKICGYIPFFSYEYNNYSNFYTKYLLLSHFSIINIPLTYYCYTKENNIVKKICLIFIIFVQVFLIPTLAVNRGIFLIGALLLTATVYYLGKRTFLKVAICLIFAFAGYEIGSLGRHYTNELLSSSFKQNESEIIEENNQNNEISEENQNSETIKENNSSKQNDTILEETIPTNEYSEYLEKVNDNTYIVHNTNNSLSDITFKIPEKILFIYSYLTVSHDNFDLIVKYNDEYSLGIRQLLGFDFILKRIIPNYKESLNYYYVQFNLNTNNFLGTSISDFGIIGLIIFCAVFGFISGFIEASYLKSNRIIDLLILSILSYCVVLSFFSNYTCQIIFIINFVSLFFIVAILKLLERGFSKNE